MKLDYKEIGRRIARRRKQLGLKQAAVEELADLGDKYLSSIETGKSIPSTEVIMRLALALDTTPDEFLVGTARREGDVLTVTLKAECREEIGEEIPSTREIPGETPAE